MIQPGDKKSKRPARPGKSEKPNLDNHDVIGESERKSNTPTSIKIPNTIAKTLLPTMNNLTITIPLPQGMNSNNSNSQSQPRSLVILNPNHHRTASQLQPEQQHQLQQLQQMQAGIKNSMKEESDSSNKSKDQISSHSQRSSTQQSEQQPILNPQQQQQQVQQRLNQKQQQQKQSAILQPQQQKQSIQKDKPAEQENDKKLGKSIKEKSIANLGNGVDKPKPSAIPASQPSTPAGLTMQDVLNKLGDQKPTSVNSIITPVEQEKPKKKYKNLIDSDSDDDEFLGKICIKKKKVEEKQEIVEEKTKKENQKNDSHIVIVNVQPLNINKYFKDILTQTSRDQLMLAMVRNLLSAGSKKLAEKQLAFKKKWNNLRNSNCSQDEYVRWEEQIKRTEFQEISEIKEAIINRLIHSKLKGFFSAEQILEQGKREHLVKNKDDEFKEYILNEQQFKELREDQFDLLDMIMKESSFVSIDMSRTDSSKQSRDGQFSGNNFMDLESISSSNITGGSNAFGISNKNEAEKQLEIFEDEENTVYRVSLCKYFSTSTAKQEVNYDNDVEKNIEQFAYKKIFSSYDEFINLKSTDDTIMMTKRVKSLLLDIKSDELFTDNKFQKEQFDKYQKILKKIYDKNQQMDLNKVSEETLKELMELAAYIMNNVHYFQKFNLKCDLLHPLDLIYVIDQFLKSTNHVHSNNYKKY